MKRNSGHTRDFLIMAVLSVIIIYIATGSLNYTSSTSIDGEVYDATVTEITEVVESVIMETTNTEVSFVAEIKSGELKGESFRMVQTLSDSFYDAASQVEIGDNIICSPYASPDAADGTYIYLSHNRIPTIWFMVAGLVLLTFIIGGTKGLYAAFALAVTMATIFLYYLPAILSGENIYTTTVFVAVFVIISNLVMLNGFSQKTLCAILGNLGGIGAAAILAFAANSIFGITGALDDDYFMLTMLGDISIDLVAIVWGSVIIGSLGAIMDVSMSVASSVKEIADGMFKGSPTRLLRSGMEVGRDAIGTMTTTLILAYVGSSLAPILLFSAYSKDPLILLNLEMILVEIISGAVGSVGILCAVPITVFLGTAMFGGKGDGNGSDLDEDGDIIPLI